MLTKMELIQEEQSIRTEAYAKVDGHRRGNFSENILYLILRTLLLIVDCLIIKML
jgi:hypothetical protein